MKTNELTDAALDWAVEVANGTHWSPNGYFVYPIHDPDFIYSFTTKTRNYSTDWSQGGRIIERENIAVSPCSIVRPDAPWVASSAMGNVTILGPTPLIAAMRCFAASKLGDNVEIPKELTT